MEVVQGASVVAGISRAAIPPDDASTVTWCWSALMKALRRDSRDASPLGNVSSVAPKLWLITVRQVVVDHVVLGLDDLRKTRHSLGLGHWRLYQQQVGPRRHGVRILDVERGLLGPADHGARCWG